jgi:hypothetical protein
MSAGKLAKRVTQSTEASPKKRRAIAMAAPTVAPHFRPTDLTGVTQVKVDFRIFLFSISAPQNFWKIKDYFMARKLQIHFPLQESFRLEGKEFCVWGSQKQKFEKLIAAHGGKITQNAGNAQLSRSKQGWFITSFALILGSKTYAIVTDRKESVRVKNLLFANEDGFSTWDVLHSNWLERAVSGLASFNPEPSDYILTSRKTQLHLETLFDAYGDSFEKPASRESLLIALDKVPKSSSLDLHLLDQLEEQILGESTLRSIFRPCIAYFDQFLQVCNLYFCWKD